MYANIEDLLDYFSMALHRSVHEHSSDGYVGYIVSCGYRCLSQACLHQESYDCSGYILADCWLDSIRWQFSLI